MNIRQYKKKYYVCKDDFGRMLYAGDMVEISCPVETNTTWQANVYWDRLHGAFVDSHPSHIAMGHTKIRDLWSLLGQDDVCINYHGEESPRTVKGFVRKVKSFYE